MASSIGHPFRHKWSYLPKMPSTSLLISSLNFLQLAGFVFENEPHFAPSVQAAARMANTMAQLDGMVESNFEQRSTMEKYMLDVG
jgi:hypothetical protein